MINKKYIRIISIVLGWSFILAYMIIALSFTNDKTNAVICKKINIEMQDSIEFGFIDRYDILSLFKSKEIKLYGYPIEQINTKKLEDIVLSYPPVKSVQIYKKINGTLSIDIKQREPIVRIFDQYNRSFYIDIDGIIMPLSAKYTSHTMVANGMIESNVKIKNGASVITGYVNDSTESIPVNRLEEIYYLSKYIYLNLFWRSQILQIYLNSDQEYELIPRVGSHLIIFGGIDQYEYKFRKLKTLYQKGFSSLGWNKYNKIILKYSNQVICTK